VRRAATADAADLAALSGELGYPTTEAEMTTRLLKLEPGAGVFVVELDGRVAGFVHVFEQRLLVSPGFAELGGLVVGTWARRRGAGRALLDEAARWAKDRGLASLRIRAGAARPEAHPFYQSAGCRFVKEQRVYERTVGGRGR